MTVTARGRRAPLQRSRRWLRILSVVGVLALWEALGRADPSIASYPTQIVAALIETTFVDNRILPAFTQTMYAIVVGFAISAVAGVVIGFAMARLPLLALVLDPYVNALYATPRITLIPLLILWLGIDFQLRVAICVLSAIFPIIINTSAGVRTVDRDHILTAQAFGASEWQLIRTVVLPGSLPAVFVGLRLGIIHALIGVIVAEMTAGATGVGYLLLVFGQFFQADLLLGPVMLLGLLSIAMAGLVNWLHRRATPGMSDEARGL